MSMSSSMLDMCFCTQSIGNCFSNSCLGISTKNYLRQRLYSKRNHKSGRYLQLRKSGIYSCKADTALKTHYHSISPCKDRS